MGVILNSVVTPDQRASGAESFSGSPVQRAIVAIVTVKIAGILLIFDVIGFQAFDFPKSLFSRALAWLLVGVLAAAVIQHGIRVVPRTRLHLAAVGVVFANAISALFAENTYLALYGDRDRYLGLTFVLDMAVLYLAVAVAFRRRTDWAIFGTGVATAALLSVAYAWAQYVGLDPITWSEDPAIRPFGTLGHPDHFGHLLSVLFSVLVALAVAGRKWLSRSARLGMASFCLVVVGTAAIVATRATLLGILAALAILPLIYVRAGGGRRSLRTGALIGIPLLTLAAVALSLTPLGERAGSAAEAVAPRTALWLTAARAFADRPLIGHGPDSFGAAFPRYTARDEQPVVEGQYNSSAHNWPLQTAATTGVIGMLATAALIAGALVGLWRRTPTDHGPVCIAFIVASVAYWSNALATVGTVSVDWLPWLALGAAASAQAPPLPGRAQSSHRRGLLAAACAVPAIIVATTGAAAFQANRDAWDAGQLGANDPAGASSAARSAVGQDPGRSEYWNVLGSTYAGAGMWSEAASAYEAAATRAPHEMRYWVNLIRSSTRAAGAGAPEGLRAALDAAQRAADLHPNDLRIQITLSETAFAAGHDELALDSALGAISFDPKRNLDFLVTRPAAQVTDLARARARLQSIIALRDTASLRIAFAQLELRAGDTSAARAHATRALELSPGNAEATAILRRTGG